MQGHQVEYNTLRWVQAFMFTPTVILISDKIAFAYNFCFPVSTHLSRERMLDGFWPLPGAVPASQPPSQHIYPTEMFRIFQLEEVISCTVHLSAIGRIIFHQKDSEKNLLHGVSCVNPSPAIPASEVLSMQTNPAAFIHAAILVREAPIREDWFGFFPEAIQATLWSTR